jgi:putative addiction module component (TIGR02574 family)
MTYIQITELPLAQRIELMESLWDSLCHEPTVSSAIPDWHLDVLADRVARLDSGEESVTPWADAKARIRAQAGKL